MAAISTNNDHFFDPYWRLSNLYLIQDKRGRTVVFQPNSSQIELLRALEETPRLVLLKARQRGFTTAADLWSLDKALWTRNFAAGIIAHNLDDAKVIYRTKVDFPYRHLPEQIQEAMDAQIDRAGELVFSNGSSVRVSTSYRSGTLQALHVSEFGKIAAERPDRAREIMTGALEAVPTGGTVIIESTAEGREGAFYELCDRAIKHRDSGKPVGPLDFAFFFEPWWKNPDYRLDGPVDSGLESYWRELEGKHGISLNRAQRAWYSAKMAVLGDDMHREYPSFPGEAFRVATEGAYYREQLANARISKRIGYVAHDPTLGVDTWWDIGLNDEMAIWLVQNMGPDYRLIDYYENTGEPLDHYVRWLNQRTGQGSEQPCVFRNHYLPHDARHRRLNATSVDTVEDMLAKLGLRGISTVQRPRNTDEVLRAIHQCRGFLSTCRIDEERCRKGILALESYRKKWNERLGAFADGPLHNWASNGADALRTGVTGSFTQIHDGPGELEPEPEPEY